ncbi:serine/threonine protein kinase [Chlamydia muridarum str. Nigg]|uniref:Serine/threonine-protein kinase PknD n=2 Tax=Chlamydia muridarum TaxID=83560 RepID=PKND_CHLMU|nr:serine/threonine-protein kinase PknD [Chlamydia muridarum]Q9PK92.1 RecName: Full=Serine/threonine-protein kinase PknD [Chlamydia muridarum str. Nigg]UFT48552.1 serine/threonine-protein kinase PknD [Chlamydia trachomatis]AAF73573.1 serine/threonine protein kinase [Chlamydia muridarum str. Nigg]AHH22963.1 serine/threonine protein kinase [Chlamydia muridarum str. Nigg3 CMUT3-5]AHH23888.1 serine/threonine protein kinase [Chlamydia muridarum str. Nigg CM972]AID38095.1 serine/threonine protein k
MQRYELIRLIGRGGMGEVYLAHDKACSRRVALKKIREDLSDNPLLRKRFLREAKIAADLIHPGIVPVYSICSDGESVYYTMPYIEGFSLKHLLKSVWQKEILSKELEEKTSVKAFLPIFDKICATVEYIHSKGVLHRDLKPDNILLGLFGEVVIVDWGAAIFKHAKELQQEKDEEGFSSYGQKNICYSSMTVPGKIVGTPDYMAPESLLGAEASEKTDIYALGLILYQMLTLSFPYRRKKGRKLPYEDSILSPIEMAPYREIPPSLSQIAMKAIAVDPVQRFSSVQELRKALQPHLQGESEWTTRDILSTKDRKNWKYYEPILLSRYFPVLASSPAQWYNFMLSDMEVNSSVRVECSVTKSSVQEGVGIFFPPSKEADKGEFYCGYGLWFSSQNNELSVSLIKNGIEIQKESQGIIPQQSRFAISIEKSNNKITVFVDQILFILHIDYLPSLGERIEIIIQDLQGISNITILESIGALRVSCLAVPDAFLAEKLYDQAARFYRKIRDSFPGRKESYEAQFRLGVTLLTQIEEQGGDLMQALSTFDLLHGSTGAPLEYLGKALVYQRNGSFVEEIRSLLLALKRYPQHPEIPRLKDHLCFRLYDSLHKHRSEALVFMLLILWIAPEKIGLREEERFLEFLHHRQQSTLFCRIDKTPLQFKSSKMELFLSFWTGFTLFLPELFQRARDLRDYQALIDIFYVVCASGNKEVFSQFAEDLAIFVDEVVFPKSLHNQRGEELVLFVQGLAALQNREYRQAKEFISAVPFALQLYALDLFSLQAFIDEEVKVFSDFLQDIYNSASAEDHKHVLVYMIQVSLWNQDLKQAYELLSKNFPQDKGLIEYSEAFVLWGCYLALTGDRSAVKAHFSRCQFKYGRSALIGKCIDDDSLDYLEGLVWWEKKKTLFQSYFLLRCLHAPKERYEVYRQAYISMENSFFG